MPKLLLIHGKTTSFVVPPKLSPFNIGTIVGIVDGFLKPVEKNQRVLMAFNNPKGLYENIFDGYRRLLEVPLYVASCKQFHFFPDWWAVSDTNYQGAPNIWGRDLSEVNENVSRWECDYVVVYQNHGTELEKHWECTGYEVLSTLDWSENIGKFRGAIPWKSETPKWWLLKVPNAIKYTLENTCDLNS